MEEANLLVTRIPQVGALSVNAPMGFIAVGDFGGLDLVPEILVQRGCAFGGAMSERHRGGRDKGHREKPREYLANVAV